VFRAFDKEAGEPVGVGSKGLANPVSMFEFKPEIRQ
jgi:hypothetical protein